jgi:hypothetical protein
MIPLVGPSIKRRSHGQTDSDVSSGWALSCHYIMRIVPSFRASWRNCDMILSLTGPLGGFVHHDLELRTVL